jgi:predicted NBD/HSP70 family sugar kinase
VLADVDLSLLTECVEEKTKKYPKISSIAIGVPGSVDNGRIFYFSGYGDYKILDLISS